MKLYKFAAEAEVERARRKKNISCRGFPEAALSHIYMLGGVYSTSLLEKSVCRAICAIPSVRTEVNNFMLHLLIVSFLTSVDRLASQCRLSHCHWNQWGFWHSSAEYAQQAEQRPHALRRRLLMNPSPIPSHGTRWGTWRIILGRFHESRRISIRNVVVTLLFGKFIQKTLDCNRVARTNPRCRVHAPACGAAHMAVVEEPLGARSGLDLLTNRPSRSTTPHGFLIEFLLPSSEPDQPRNAYGRLNTPQT